MFWSLPSVTSRPSAFGLNSGSCFRCPYLLIQAQVFCFLLSAFLLRAEKPPCSVMDCHGAMCLTCCSPPSLDIVNMSRSPRLWKTTPCDLTLPLSVCEFRPKTALDLGVNSYFPCLGNSRTSMGTGSGRDVPGILQLIYLASVCAE